jgi:hypothetical protein
LGEPNDTRDETMICPGTTIDCDNPGCRRGGCQGRLPELPLFQAVRAGEPEIQPASASLVLPHAPAERSGNPKRLAA